jgi:hypothetical protein
MYRLLVFLLAGIFFVGCSSSIKYMDDDLAQGFISPAFRVKAKHPELWNATNGKIRILSAFFEGDETTVVPLKLEPFESVFIVFREKTGTRRREVSWKDNYPFPVTVTELKGPWTVRFDSSQGG